MTKISTEEGKRNYKFNQPRLELGEDSKKQKQSWQEGKGEMLEREPPIPLPFPSSLWREVESLEERGKEWKFLTYSERLVCWRSRKD